MLDLEKMFRESTPHSVGEETESREGVGVLHSRTQRSLASVPGTMSSDFRPYVLTLSFRTGDN